MALEEIGGLQFCVVCVVNMTVEKYRKRGFELDVRNSEKAVASLSIPLFILDQFPGELVNRNGVCFCF